MVTPSQALVGTPFNRMVTEAEIAEIIAKPALWDEYKARLKAAPISIDANTFQPYVVIDDVCWPLECAADVVGNNETH